MNEEEFYGRVLDPDQHNGVPVFVGYIDKQPIFQNAHGYCDAGGITIPKPDLRKLTHPEDQYAALVELIKSAAMIFASESQLIDGGKQWKSQAENCLNRLKIAIQKAVKASGYDYIPLGGHKVEFYNFVSDLCNDEELFK